MLNPGDRVWSDTPFDVFDPAALQAGLDLSVRSYQSSRSAWRAWQVVHYAEALSRHPDFEGPDEQRCVYRRLARHWRGLAVAGDGWPQTDAEWGTR